MTTAIGACGRYGKNAVGILLSSSDLRLDAKPGFLTLRQRSVTRTKSTRGTTDGFECPASHWLWPHRRQGSCDRRSCGGAAVHRHGNRRHHDTEPRTGRNRESSHSCVSARQLQATHGQWPRPRPARPRSQRSGRKDRSWQAVARSLDWSTGPATQPRSGVVAVVQAVPSPTSASLWAIPKLVTALD